MKIEKIVLNNVILSAEKITDEKGTLNGVNLKVSPVSKNHVYHTSAKQVVNYFPTELETDGVNLDLKSLYDLILALSNSISTYLYELRKPVNSGEINLLSYSKLEKDSFLKINVTNHFFKSGNLGKDKVTISFFENDEDFGENELIAIPFTKRDVILLFSLFKELISGEFRTKSFFLEASKINIETNEEISRETIALTKVDNAIVIDSTWLHGQEMLNLMYVVEKLMQGFKIENDLSSLIFSYRQLKVSIKNGIAFLEVRRFDENNTSSPNKMVNGEPYYLRIALAGYFLPVLAMFLDVKVLRHADIDHELDSTKINETSRSIFISNPKIKYHISTKESFIGVGVHKAKKSDYSSLIFSASVKENVYSVEDEDSGIIFDSMFEKNGKKIQVLNHFTVNLKEHWHKFIKGLALAYTEEYKDWKKDRNITKFFVTVLEDSVWYKYEFSILSTADNKVAAVLTIDKFKMVKGEDAEFVASFRQPLFRKYLYQLLIMSMELAEFFPKEKFIMDINKKDLLKYRYKSLKTVKSLKNNEIIRYGFKRKNNKVSWGVFSETNDKLVELSENDKFFLRISAERRLKYGDWIPFVGDKICIGSDKYLTDLNGEFNLEKTYGLGVEMAIYFYFGMKDVNPHYAIQGERDDKE